jgi:hypothetical protein
LTAREAINLNVLPVILRLSGSEYHNHLPALQLRLQFDLGNSYGLFLHLDKELHAEFLVRHFAAAEAKRHLDLIAFLEKLLHGAHLNLVVMRVDIRAELDFLDLDGLLLFSRLRGLLLGLEPMFSEIHDLADRDFSVCSDFNEIETGLLGFRQRVALGDCPVVLSILVDELNIARINRIIYARPSLCGRVSDYRTAYVTSPMAVDGRERGIVADQAFILQFEDRNGE